MWQSCTSVHESEARSMAARRANGDTMTDRSRSFQYSNGKPQIWISALSWRGSDIPWISNTSHQWMHICMSEDDFPSNNSSVTFGSASEEDDLLPTPILLIDQDSDPDATIVWLSFGDRLGALLDTTQSLRNLGLDVTKGTVTTEDSIVKTNFLITLQGRKVDNPDMLEKIRLTIINNLLEYHPESSQRLAMGEVFGIIPPKKLDVDVNTLVLLQDDGPNKSLLYIETIDRPGLLLEIINIVTDISIDVKSAEINTEGLVAKDKFHVGYKGAALPISLSQVLVNTLRYYLGRPDTEEDSY